MQNFIFNKVITSSIPIFSLTILITLSDFAFAAEPNSKTESINYGIFMIVKGTVNFTNPKMEPQKAKVGTKVFEGATITTEKDSRAKIVMSDRNVLNISPETKMMIQKYDTSPDKKNVSLSLEDGKIRVNVEQKYDGQKEKFLLKTPTVVAGVRGTQFLASYNQAAKTSQIVTFKGSVTMTSLNSTGKAISTVVVEKGQSSTASANQPPEPPKTLPKDEIKELDKSSTTQMSDSKKSNSSTNPNTEKNSDSEKEKAKNDEVKNDEAKNSDSKNPDQQKDDQKKENNDKTKQEDAKKEELKKEDGKKTESQNSDSKKNEITDKKNTNKSDFDSDIAKDIKVPTQGQGTEVKPAPLQPPPVIKTLPNVNIPKDLIKDVIQNQNSKTKVNIKIK